VLVPGNIQILENIKSKIIDSEVIKMIIVLKILNWEFFVSIFQYLFVNSTRNLHNYTQTILRSHNFFSKKFGVR
jgi:hypothetical protein